MITKITTILFFLSSLYLNSVNSQIGFKGNYTTSISSSADIEQSDISGFSVGLDYMIRLKNYRVEFLPTIRYNQLSNNANELAQLIDNQSLLLELPVSIYILQIESDCDCPTVYNNESFIKKGLYLQLIPGYSINDIVGDNGNNENNFYLGGGMGIDIGISRFIKITPVIQLIYNFKRELEFNNTIINYSHLDFRPGIRIGIRLDGNDY